MKKISIVVLMLAQASCAAMKHVVRPADPLDWARKLCEDEAPSQEHLKACLRELKKGQSLPELNRCELTHMSYVQGKHADRMAELSQLLEGKEVVYKQIQRVDDQCRPQLEECQRQLAEFGEKEIQSEAAEAREKEEAILRAILALLAGRVYAPVELNVELAARKKEDYFKLNGLVRDLLHELNLDYSPVVKKPLFSSSEEEVINKVPQRKGVIDNALLDAFEESSQLLLESATDGQDVVNEEGVPDICATDLIDDHLIAPVVKEETLEQRETMKFIGLMKKMGHLFTLLEANAGLLQEERQQADRETREFGWLVMQAEQAKLKYGVMLKRYKECKAVIKAVEGLIV